MVLCIFVFQTKAPAAEIGTSGMIFSYRTHGKQSTPFLILKVAGTLGSCFFVSFCFSINYGKSEVGRICLLHGGWEQGVGFVPYFICCIFVYQVSTFFDPILENMFITPSSISQFLWPILTFLLYSKEACQLLVEIKSNTQTRFQYFESRKKQKCHFV